MLGALGYPIFAKPIGQLTSWPELARIPPWNLTPRNQISNPAAATPQQTGTNLGMELNPWCGVRPTEIRQSYHPFLSSSSSSSWWILITGNDILTEKDDLSELILHSPKTSGYRAVVISLSSRAVSFHLQPQVSHCLEWKLTAQPSMVRATASHFLARAITTRISGTSHGNSFHFNGKSWPGRASHRARQQPGTSSNPPAPRAQWHTHVHWEWCCWPSFGCARPTPPCAKQKQLHKAKHSVLLRGSQGWHLFRLLLGKIRYNFQVQLLETWSLRNQPTATRYPAEQNKKPPSRPATSRRCIFVFIALMLVEIRVVRLALRYLGLASLGEGFVWGRTPRSKRNNRHPLKALKDSNGTRSWEAVKGR